VRGIPAGSIVQIDQQSPTAAVTVVAAGRHEIAISAPQHHFLVDTIEVSAGDTVIYSPRLLPTSTSARDAGSPRRQVPARSRVADAPARTPARTPAPAPASDPCEPGTAYDASQCFDERPNPRQAPFVVIPDGAERPDRGTIFWVHVSAQGESSELRTRRESGSVAFDREAAEFARRLTWTPARKAGAPVAVWVPLEVRPAAR